MAPRTSLMNSGSMIEDNVTAGRSRCLSPSRVSSPVSHEPDAHRLAAPEGRKPPEPHREDRDQKDAGEKHRDRDAEHAKPENESCAPRSRLHRAIDAGGERDEEHDKARGKHELEARWELGEDNRDRRPLVDVGVAEIALRRAAEIARELRRPRRVEAELVAKLGALRLRNRLAHDLAQGIAERALHRKRDHGDRQHHENGLASALGEEG